MIQEITENIQTFKLSSKSSFTSLSHDLIISYFDLEKMIEDGKSIIHSPKISFLRHSNDYSLWEELTIKNYTANNIIVEIKSFSYGDNIKNRYFRVERLNLDI